MTTRTLPRIGLVAGLAWLVVAGSGMRDAMADGDANWRAAYAVFSVALVVGAVLGLVGASQVSRESDRPRLRVAGLFVGGVGCAVALVGAWALPAWMALLGAGFAMLAGATGVGSRRALAAMAAAQLLGIAVLIGGIEAEIGPIDDYGDYPAAGGVAVVFVALTMMAALGELVRGAERAPV